MSLTSKRNCSANGQSTSNKYQIVPRMMGTHCILNVNIFIICDLFKFVELPCASFKQSCVRQVFVNKRLEMAQDKNYYCIYEDKMEVFINMISIWKNNSKVRHGEIGKGLIILFVFLRFSVCLITLMRFLDNVFIWLSNFSSFDGFHWHTIKVVILNNLLTLNCSFVQREAKHW